MVKLWKFFICFAVLESVSSTPTLRATWRNVRALSELIRALQSNPNVQKGVSQLQQNFKRAATMGLVLGTVQVEKKMEVNVMKLLNEFLKNLQKSNTAAAIKKMKEIETTMHRDKQAIEILKNAMDLAMKTKTIRDYREALNNVAKADVTSKNQKPKKTKEIDKKMAKELQSNVQSHLKLMHKTVDASVQQTISSMGGKKKSETVSTPPTVTSPNTHMTDIFNRDIVRLPQFHVQLPIWSPVYQFDVESFYRFRRQNDDEKEDENEQSENKVEDSKENEEEEFEDELGPPANNGGLAGLIASLSGGEGGSDVGALIGAISGVVTKLFGPGGLDIPSLLSTGTSLLAGLLSGDDNFGKVLANYIGISVEGLSGGGGAENNGIFFGNFVGTLLASLSADPEEEAGPQPKLFVDSFFKGFGESKQKRGTDETSSSDHKGVTNFILNASIGSSGGSSQGSADLSSGSSQGSHKGSASASQTSAAGSMHMPKPQPK